ncbi:MAG: DUF4407 domain-containing protein [Flavobacterium sp.]|nr:MAG: DUF4407 domain-containing protein [Flavobacterium sp.]
MQAIALAKKAEYEKLDAEYKLLATQEQVKMDSADAALQRQELSIRQEEKAFEAYLNNGFLTRINALSNLLKNNPPLQYRYYLIIFILMLIELMPVIAKTMLPSGTYDEKARLQEEMEIDLANSSILRTKATKERFSEAAFEQDTELIDRFLLDTKEERLEKMRKWSS